MMWLASRKAAMAAQTTTNVKITIYILLSFLMNGKAAPHRGGLFPVSLSAQSTSKNSIMIPKPASAAVAVADSVIIALPPF